MSHRLITRLVATWAVLAVLGIAACSAPDNPPDDVDGIGPITFVDGEDTSYGAQIRALVDTWNAQHSEDQKVNFLELQPDTDILRSQMAAQFQDLADAGSPGTPVPGCYDVVMTDVIRTPEFARAGYIAELDRRDFDTSAYLRPPLKSAIVDGKLYAIPMRTDAAFLYYRKDILAGHGLSPPTTWPELATQARALASPPDLAGYVSQFNLYEGFTVNVLEAIWAFADESTRSADLPRLLESPAGKAGIELLANGFREQWISSAAAGHVEEDDREAFQSGHAVFMRNWPYAYKLLKADAGFKDKFDIAVLPGPSVLGGWNIAIGACSRHRRTARAFMAFLSSEPSQRTLFEKAGFAPTIAALYDDPELVATYPYLARLKSSVNNALTRPSTAYYPRVTEAVQERLHPVIVGREALDEALPDLLADVRQAMAGR
jgi:multiple sugar transport system substrate-binding protein